MLRLQNTAMGSDTGEAMAELWNEGKILIENNPQLMDCHLVCKDGDTQANRAIVAVHSQLLASAMTGEADEEEILLPEVSVEHLRPLLAVMHGSRINKDWTNDVLELAVLLGLDSVVAFAAACKDVSQTEPAMTCSTESACASNQDIGSSSKELQSGCEAQSEAKDAGEPADEILQTSEETGRSTEEDLKYIFGETFVEPREMESGTKEMERRRSRRSNQGQHWKFSKNEKRKAAPKISKENESEESIMSDLTSTLEAFDKEITEDDLTLKRKRESLNHSEHKRKSQKLDVIARITEGCQEHGEDQQTTAVEPKDGQSLASSSYSSQQRRSKSGKVREVIKEGEMVGMYHLRKCSTYLSLEEAKKVLPTYYTLEEGIFSCKICQLTLTTDTAIEQHLLDVHLNLLLYKCELCSMKLRTKEDYNSHIFEEHGASHIETMEVPETVDQVVSHVEEEGPGMEQSVTTTIIINEEKADDQTVLYLAEAAVDDGEESVDNKKRRGRVKTEEIYVAGADRPILGKTKAKLDKLTRGRLFSQEEAEELVKQNLNRTIVDRLYHCLVCKEDWATTKLDQAREHVYDHYGVYLFQCDLCLDLFRKQAHYLRHKEIHNKREEEKAVAEADKVGNYHLLDEPKFLPWKEAKPVIDTYFKREEGGRNLCKLCPHSCTSGPAMRSHLLADHLKLTVFRCPECNETFGPEPDIKKHMLEEHALEWEGLERVDDPEYESTETEIDVEDLTSVPLEELSGKKISSAQGRLLRKTRITKNEEAGHYECELCDFKKEFMAQLSDHVMTAHYNVFIYRCPVESCGKLLRNWSRYTTHRSTHTREKAAPTPRARRQPFRSSTGPTQLNHHLLTEDVYVGKEEGLRIARDYFTFNEDLRKYQCKMCKYQGRHQTTEQHVLAIHLRRLHLFKCDTCGKMIRYSENAFKDHQLLHTQGKLPCELCQGMDQGGEKRFTKASLAAHMRRIHKEGRFECKTEGCQVVCSTLAELRSHERQEHFQGLPASRLQYMCDICHHTFPRRQQLDWHLDSCQAGRSRSRFRKMIADCLTWMGNGVYVCNFCQETFQPPRPTASSLPLARKHVVTVHKMNHLRKAKMSWTQGVEGLNLKKKALRKEQALETVEVHDGCDVVVVKEDDDGTRCLEETTEEVVLEQLYLVNTEEVANTEVVEVDNLDLQTQQEVEIDPKIRVINTYINTT